tara:strand:- start:165 stop:674 length:510 start_codon:yes stop_codon:yes gene_type:complete
MTDLWKQVRNLAATVTVISALFFVLSVGIGTTYDVLTDPELVEMNAAQFQNGLVNDTTTDAMDAVDAFGGDIDFVERIGLLGMVLIAASPVGLGLLKTRGNGARIIDQAVQYAMPIVALIAFITLGDTIMEVINGDRVWENFGDSQNAWILGNTGALVAGIAAFLNMRD